MSAKIFIEQCKTLHPEQWVKLYGVVSNRWEYINTFQAYQLETVVSGISLGWFKDIALYLVDEEECPIAIAEVINNGRF
ncbi:hypothetical protein [Allocoleopsis sp.]|uniref:hypothetical protein n=1 Tax=Allocoleopsis sp. TaxID=3088169 RepID=UPI002FD02CD6